MGIIQTITVLSIGLLLILTLIYLTYMSLNLTPDVLSVTLYSAGLLCLIQPVVAIWFDLIDKSR